MYILRIIFVLSKLLNHKHLYDILPALGRTLAMILLYIRKQKFVTELVFAIAFFFFGTDFCNGFIHITYYLYKKNSVTMLVFSIGFFKS